MSAVSPPSRRQRTGAFLAVGLLVAVGLAFFVSQVASSYPDGLEKVAGQEGFLDTADDHALADSPFADYAAEGIDDEGLATGVAGGVGVALTFLVAGGLVWVVSKLPKAARARP